MAPFFWIPKRSLILPDREVFWLPAGFDLDDLLAPPSVCQMLMVSQLGGGMGARRARRTLILTNGSNTYNYNLRTQALSAGLGANEPAMVLLTNNAWIGSTSTSAYAFDTGTGWPAGTELQMINNGLIMGCGGAGGSGETITHWGGQSVNPTFSDMSAGGNGGHAMRVQHAIAITNNANIWGGGGGGGGGGAAFYEQGGELAIRYYGAGGGGGGGAGFNGGASGPGGTNVGNASGVKANGSAGSGGSWNVGGNGGNGGSVLNGNVVGGRGGNGGGPGQNGSSGSASTVWGAGYRGGAAGGAAGNYCVGNSLVTWIATGDRRGGVS